MVLCPDLFACPDVPHKNLLFQRTVSRDSVISFDPYNSRFFEHPVKSDLPIPYGRFDGHGVCNGYLNHNEFYECGSSRTMMKKEVNGS